MSITFACIVPHPPLIVPQIGKGRETDIGETAESYHKVMRHIASLKPETVIMISPHALTYPDYIHISAGDTIKGDLSRFGAGAVYEAKLDRDLAQALDMLCADSDFPAGTPGADNTLDHGTLVPLYFLNQYYKDYKFLRVSVSGLPKRVHYGFGKLLGQAVEQLGINAVVIASGDLSHKLKHDGPYGYAPEGPELDDKLVGIMKSAEFGGFLELSDTLSAAGAECGLRAFLIMSGALDKKSVSTQFYSYEGPFGVGYAVCGYTPAGGDPSRDYLAKAQAVPPALEHGAFEPWEDPFVGLARRTLEFYVINGEMPPVPPNLPDELTRTRAGVFVSLKKSGQLRGCIGTIEPTKPNIAQEIMANAVSSGTSDPRFEPVRMEELTALVYNVDVLSPREAINDKSQLDVKRYGVIVTLGHRRGLLLPNLEGVNTIDEQLNIACQKAGIRSDEPYKLERFEVVRHI